MEHQEFLDYKCLQCDAAFATQAELIAHNTEMHSNKDHVPVPHP
jgi:hypothetical protein